MARPVEWRPRGVLHPETMRGEARPGRYLPEPPLDAFVEHYWTVEWDHAGQPPVLRETLPHPSVHLVLEKGRSCLIGVHRQRFVRLLEGRGRVLGIKFLPGGFRPFWSSPISTLTDRRIPLGKAFGPEGETLEREVLACEGPPEAAIARAEAFLLARLPPADPKAGLARRIVSLILENPSVLRAEFLAEATGLSLRALQRLFKDYVGVSPKRVIQRYRLHEAMERLEGGHPLDLASLALDLGYCDQAHFSRDFKTLLGRSPGVYAAPPRPGQ